MLIAVFTGALKWYSNCNSAGTETRQPRDWVRWTAEKVQNNVKDIARGRNPTRTLWHNACGSALQLEETTCMSTSTRSRG